jgi:hypothetical protein
MNIDRFFIDRVRLAFASGIVLGLLGSSGCGPEGVGSAPKLKGSKDEIQKAYQSGKPGAKRPGQEGKNR